MPEPNNILRDLVYARLSNSGGSRVLTLDLYLPDGAPQPYPLIVWIHGGAWLMGDKSWCSEALPLLEAGYAIASLDYRLSQEASFPAQICDVKAAVRWLRAHAAQYHLDPERFGAGGPSAGGHLAALLGVSFYKKDWDQQGDYDECADWGISSAVQAVCDWFGPSDFLRMDDMPVDSPHNAPDSPESLLIGAPIQDNQGRAGLANPINYVYPVYPPFLILHGDQDRTVPPNQSILLHEALRRWWVNAELVILPGARHGFEGSDFEQAVTHMHAFFNRELKEKPLPRNIYYACTPATFRPRTRHAVHWLNPYTDYPLARAYWLLAGTQNDLSEAAWQEAHDMGYSYAACIVDGKIVSLAAVLRYANVAWELAAVSTCDPMYRQQGYATSVCSFVTKYIMAMQRIATVSTAIDNIPMQRTAEAIGFRRC